MGKWNDHWIDELKVINYDCYKRLAECRNIRKDILFMAKLIIKYNKNRSKEDCLDRIVEWVTDWNNQPELYDYIDNNYKKFIVKMGG